MALTDTAIKKAKPAGKRFKLPDFQGLYLEIMTSGSKIFRYRYKIDGKDNTFALGEYPALSLADARKRRDDARALVKQGIHPKQHYDAKKASKQAEIARIEAEKNKITFSDLFELWHEHNSQTWSFEHAKDIRSRVENHLLPLIGSTPLDEIKPKNVIEALKQIESRGILETMKRIRQYMSRVFRYGVGMGYCENDPVRDLPNDIFKKQVKGNFHHITNTEELQQLLLAIDRYIGGVSTAQALKLAPFVFLRPKELAGLRWDEVDLSKQLITINSDRMKMKRDHLVPLSDQALEIISNMHTVTGHSDFVFLSSRKGSLRPMSEQSLNAGLHRIGFQGKQTAHGFRHTASTLLNEMGFEADHIEKQLAHESGNKVRAVYNKAQYLNQRTLMMQKWADFLVEVKEGKLNKGGRK